MRSFLWSRLRLRPYIVMITVLLGGFLTSISPIPASPIPQASAAAVSSITISGHGFGHGRGMGQYGAYGYALAGSSYTQILAHYYGGTILSTVSNETVTVFLSEFDSSAVITAPTATFGDWTVREGSVTRYYRGSVAKVNVGTAADPLVIVENKVPLENYVAGVVPAEAPASWGTDGFAALEAQAVAARSYALAYLAGSASICDSTACQVYEGDPNVSGSPTYSSYVTYSNRAEADTAGRILRCQASACGPAGSVARTEFSSSSGGYTAGGAFPAVPDAGDATASNPNHTWAVRVSAQTVEAAYPSIGALTSVVVDSRNGLGDLGGRVLTLTVSGTAGKVVTSGVGFAAALGLRSNWFTIGTIAGGPSVPVPPAAKSVSGGDDGYWVVGSDGSVFHFGKAPALGFEPDGSLVAPVVGMAPTTDGRGYWLVAADGGIFSFGTARFHGSTGGMRLNAGVLGMAASRDGGGYWLVASDGGIFTFGDARFYGSTGSMRLNAPVVAMAPTPDGRGYWLVASDGGVFTFGDAHFYGSTGSIHLAQPIVGMVPTSDGRGYTLVGRDGGVFAFGDATYDGSLPGLGIPATVTGVTATADNRGYLEVGADGAVYSFGDAPFDGSVFSVAPGWAGQALGIFAHRV